MNAAIANPVKIGATTFLKNDDTTISPYRFRLIFIIN